VSQDVFERVEEIANNRVARILLDTYLLGDARQSATAAAELQRRAA